MGGDSRSMTAPSSRTAPPLHAALLNWLWVAELPRWGAALEVTGGPAALGAILAAHFPVVSAAPLPGAPDAPADFPFSDLSYDLVVAHGVLGRADPGPLFRASLRVLRPGGCLGVALLQPLALRRELSARSVHALGLAWRLRHAGFQTVRKYFAEPSLERFHSIVPATRRLVSAWEKLGGREDLKGWARRGLVEAGLADLIFPVSLYLAYR